MGKFEDRRPRITFTRVPASATHGDTVPDVFRAEVPGGWLVMLSRSKSLTFIPDAKHEWLALAAVGAERG